MVVMRMSEDTASLSDDPAVLRAIIASLEAENAKLSATLRAHDLLVQTLRTRIAKLQKQAFGKSSERIEREIAQLELALEDLQVAMAEADEAAGPDDDAEDAVFVKIVVACTGFHAAHSAGPAMGPPPPASWGSASAAPWPLRPASGRYGFSQTDPMGCQLRVWPDQRCGFAARASW